jgi:type IV pilus assembly protein PilB
LRKLARKKGMVTMFEDGLRKTERGMTTIEEVLRVIRE